MLLRNHWYVAAWSADVKHEFLPRTLLGERVVLFRTESGIPVALTDRCPHRNLPLSAGKLVGERVQCGYHGLEFNAQGQCVNAPGEPRIPQWCRVNSYPVEERHGWLFIWMGDQGRASLASLPSFHTELDDPQWAGATGQLLVGCGYRLMLDNLLDLSHLAYVHSSSTGNDDVANAATVEVASDSDRHVRQTRLMRGVSAAPAFVHYGGYTGSIDRWQMTDYHAPSYIRINNGSRAQGPADDDIDCREDLGEWGFRVLHALTPETESTTHQFWAVPFRRDMVGDNEHGLWQQQMDNVLQEDHDVYSQQQLSIAQDPLAHNDARPAGALRGDRGLYEMRRTIKRLHDQEVSARDLPK